MNESLKQELYRYYKELAEILDTTEDYFMSRNLIDRMNAIDFLMNTNDKNQTWIEKIEKEAKL